MKFGLLTVVGVPLITPLAGLRFSLAGSDPEKSDQVKLPVPSLAVAVLEYAVLIVPSGNEVVVNDGVAAIVINNA